jgi:hypothetical protein
MKKLLLLVAVVGIGVGAWQLRSRSTTTATPSDSKLLVGRVWIDHLPRNERDVIQIFGMIPDEGIGLFSKRSVWAGDFEGFRFELKGDEVRAVFPQNNAKEKFRAKARTCNERGMDFCLDIEGSDHGVKRYYSREGWEIGSLHDEQHFEAGLSALETEPSSN